MPTYHLANIVDDHLMEISHVIRGEEWLPSLALHFQLYDAFGWKAPEFAHLPLILKPTGKGKLSKRDGDKLGFPVFPLEWKDPKSGEVSRGYKEDGYFTEAMVNFLAFLGWNPGTEQEIFSLEELVNAFDLVRVNKSGARFDPEKIKWFNHHYMQGHNDNGLAKQFKTAQNELSAIDDNYIAMVVSLIKERATFVSNFWSLSSFFFVAPKEYDEKASKKALKEDTKALMQELVSVLKSCESSSKEAIQDTVKSWITSNEIGFGKIMMPLRLALVGTLQGPDVFDIIYMIGKDESISRINNLINSI
jgi:glutamyl-tRNA synthetase